MLRLCSTYLGSNKLVNVELLKEMYAWAVASQRGLDKFFEDHPKYAKHNQGDWGQVQKNGVCQTAFCLAGQAAVNAGYTFVIDDTDWEPYNGHRSASSAMMVPKADVHKLGLTFVRGTQRTFARLPADADYPDTRHPSDIAAEVLGIESWEADRLFNGSNGVTDIAYHINDIFEDHGIEDRISEMSDLS
jgi:hypothetical protein